MTKTKLFAAAAVISGLIATPVMAKDMHKMHKRAKATTQQEYSMNAGDNGRGGAYRDGGYRGDYASRDTGFWPGDVAAGVVGGAVGVAGAAVNTAGNIATAPFRSSWDNSYAWNDNYNNAYNSSYNYAPRDSYAQRNGFVCQPGSVFRGEDGYQHICQ